MQRNPSAIVEDSAADRERLKGILCLAQSSGGIDTTSRLCGSSSRLSMIGREPRGVCGKGVAMRRPPDLRLIDGGVSFQVAAAGSPQESHEDRKERDQERKENDAAFLSWLRANAASVSVGAEISAPTGAALSAGRRFPSLIDGGVSFQDEPKPSRGHELDNPKSKPLGSLAEAQGALQANARPQ